jgi:hypothetical protein
VSVENKCCIFLYDDLRCSLQQQTSGKHMSITFWQVALVFLLTRNVLSSWLNNGREGELKEGKYIYLVSLYLIVFYMQGFFSSFGWPQYVLVTSYSIVIIALLANVFGKEKFLFKKSPKVCFYDASFGAFQMATVAYYGGFFNGISI